MPAIGKQVRFAYANTYHQPHPHLPPGLSFSSDTLPSSIGPITPPNGAHPLPYGAHYPSPYPLMPLPKHPSSRYPPVLLHRYLVSDAIHWTLLEHHSHATRGHHYISAPTLHEPASEPSFPSIHIFVRFSSQHAWTCPVHASNRQYVTVFDVLETLYRFLRGNVTQHDFHALSEKDRRRATRAYEERYRRNHDPVAYEKAKRSGMKRVDFLIERKHFGGLRPRADGHHQPNEFDLLVV